MKVQSALVLLGGLGLWACGPSGNNGNTESPTMPGYNKKAPATTVKSDPIRPGSIAENAPVIDAGKLYPFSEGFAVVEKGGSQALIDRSGHFSVSYNQYIFGGVPMEYWEENGRFHRAREWPGFHRGHCLAAVPSRDAYGRDALLWGSLGKDMQAVVPFTHRQFQRQTGELLFFENLNSEVACYSREGKPVAYRQPSAIPGTNHKYLSFVNYKPYRNGSENVLIVESRLSDVGKRLGLYDFEGNALTPMAFEQIENFSEGLAAFARRDDFGNLRWGFINTKGEIVIPPTFSNQPGDFHCGLARVQPSDRSSGFSFAFIDKKGDVKIRLRDEDRWDRHLLDFRNGLIVNPSQNSYMDISGKTYTLNLINGSYTDPVTGQTVTTLHNTRIDHAENRHFRPDQILFLHNGKKGLTDLNGNLLLPPVFDELSLFDPVSGLAYAAMQNPVSGQKTDGYINTKGVFVLVKSNAPLW